MSKTAEFDSPDRAATGMGGQGAAPSQAMTMALPAEFGETHSQVNLFKLLHQLFRGRYLLTIGLALGCAIIAAGIAWFVNKPGYRSVATVRVQSNKVNVLQGDENMLPWFQTMVQEQVNFLQQPRVLTAAMNTPDWLGLERPINAKSEEVFRDGLRVGVDRSSPSLIVVSYTDPDPKAAFIAVTEIVRAYERIFVETQNELSTQENLLRTEEGRTDQDIKSLTTQIESLVSQIGNQPQAKENFLNAQLNDLSLQIYEIENRLINNGAGSAVDPSTAAAQMGDPTQLTMEEIASVSMDMASLLSDRNELLGQIAQLRNSGLGDNHPEIRTLRGRLKGIEERMEQERQRFLGNRPAAEQLTSDLTVRRLQDLKMAKGKLEEEMRQHAAKARELANKESALSVALSERAAIKNRLNTLRLTKQYEQQDSRIQAILPDAPAKRPSDDNRKRWSAMMGAMGLLLPTLAIAVWGLVDRRYRYSDEALREGPSNTPMLGILPRLPADLRDQEQASAAAHCVHQIRTLIQLGKSTNRVYAVTSSNPGDGKTSMALSLALSFAGSGNKTLVIDLDMIGQGLSRTLRMREERGLHEAIIDGTYKTRIRPTHVERLSLMPTGMADDHRAASRLSEGQIVRMIESVRNEYDIVLIDTGPVLGSIEAHLVCAQADGVILVVGAGRARGQVKAAVDQLHRIGARLMGLVFNLAQPKDFRTSAASQSFRSVRPDDDRPITRPSSTEFAEFEPLPRVVALDTKR